MTLIAPGRPRAILFDWDNTLVDTWECIRDATNATLRHMGHAEWSLDETKDRVAASLRDSFPVLFGDRWPEAREVFYQAFKAIHLERLQPLPGAQAMLEDLAASGIYLGVVSNKNGDLLRLEADHLGWTRFFGRLVGANDAAADKPSDAPVHMALEGSGIPPGPAVWMVGDTGVDLECAGRAGCLPVLVRNSPPTEGEFTPYHPVHHIAGCAQLIALVRESLVPISRI